MFQEFVTRSDPTAGASRLRALRAAMAEAGVDGFLVPRADAYQGETVPPRDERLSWLTGFTGSAGLAVVTRDRAGLFVDGRYRLQARGEIDLSQFTILRAPEDAPGDWLAEVCQSGARIGYDPWLHPVRQIEDINARLARTGIALEPVANLVDAVWEDQPPPPVAPVTAHPDALAGRDAAQKRGEIAGVLREREAAAAILTLPESVAWLLNIRGSDIARTPVALAFAIVAEDGSVEVFLDPARAAPGLCAARGPQVRWLPPETLPERIDALEGRVSLDRDTAPVWFRDRLAAAGRTEIVWARDPCVLPRACKNPAEIAGARAAQLRDGAAVSNLLAWIDGAAADGGLDEIAVVRALEAERRRTNALREIAFETISGSGPNGAIVHYRVTEASNRPISPGELLLIDSGGQYADGTTDITRTVAVGAPPPKAVRPFTLVLKGLIALSELRWPPGLAGRDLDAVARVALWRAGLDYDHGTGHGVGSYLGVHEGPQGLSRRATEPLKPGMILSIEPGYYREGAFGIRTENLAVVRAPEIPAGGEREMLSFETLTLAPIDRQLIDAGLLTPDEIAWVDAYHARVRAEIGPLVAPGAAGWLAEATAPLRA